MFTTDEMLYSLLADLENWKANLPENLKYRGPDTPQNAGAGRDEIPPSLRTLLTRARF